MERHEILEAMTELKLYGMRASFDEIAGKGLNRRDEIFPLLASLIRAERTHRQARSISYRMSGARLPVLKDIGKFVFADTPVDAGLVRELATGSFVDARRKCDLCRPAPAKLTCASASRRRSFVPGRRGAFSTWSTSSISSNRRRPPAAPADSPSYGMISSPLTNWATCHSASRAASCCST
jgi:IstB-like ATP binding protein